MRKLKDGDTIYAIVYEAYEEGVESPVLLHGLCKAYITNGVLTDVLPIDDMNEDNLTSFVPDDGDFWFWPTALGKTLYG